MAIILGLVIFVATVVGISSIVPMIISFILLKIFPTIQFTFWQLTGGLTCLVLLINVMRGKK